MSQKNASDVYRDTRACGCGIGNHASDAGFHLDRVLFRDHAAIELEHHLARHDVGIGATFDAAHVQIRVRDAGHLRGHGLVERVLVIERIQDRHRALQCVDAGVRNRGVRHLAVHRHLHLQTAVVCGDHLVAEAGGDQQVRLRELVLEQPARTEFTAELLVVGEMQFDRAFQWRIQRLERTQCKDEGREVALADRRGAAIELAVDHLAAIGIVAPAFARRHHIAVGIECDGAPALTEAPTHDQVGDRLQAVVVHDRLGHRVFLDRVAVAFEDLRGAFCVRRVVAGWRVGGHLHQGLQAAHLLVEVGVDPGVELIEDGGWAHAVISLASWFSRCEKA